MWHRYGDRAHLRARPERKRAGRHLPGGGKHYYIAGNTYQAVTTETDLSNADLLDEDLQTAFDAFEAVYGIDISQPN